MLDIGWSELVLIGVVALIVVGPRDLPEMFRTLGRLTAKARMMARDFQRAMESAADESGIKDVSRDLNSIRSPVQSSLDAVNRKLDVWDTRARSARAGAATPAPGKPAPDNLAPDSLAPDKAVPEAPLDDATDEELAEFDLPEAPDAPAPVARSAAAPAIPRTVITPAAGASRPGQETKA